MVARHAAGESYQQIADRLGCCRRTVIRWVTRARREGLDALGYRSRRPPQPHPATLAPELVAHIDAIRTTHAGWGPRLIRHQLLLDGVPHPPAESTIRRWLRRLGHPPLRAPRKLPLGWRDPPPTPTDAVWQIDFKEKRLPDTPPDQKRGPVS
jgi:transposase